MKRFFVAVLAAVTLAMCTLVGCGETEEQPAGIVDPLQQYRDGYAQITSAQTISQTVEAKKNTLVNYKSEKEYVLADGSYTLTETVYTLNDLDSTSDAPYKSETTTKTVAKAETFAGKLKIDASYFAVGYTYEGGTLSASIPDEKAAEALSLSEGHAPMQGTTLVLSLSEGKLVSLKVSFTSGDYSVLVQTTFAY